MWSAEARVLVDPAGVFREAAREPHGRGASWRRPIALLFALGAMVSVLASGRFTLRLIADGAVSFAFLVAIEIVALAIVSRPRAVRRAGAGGPPALPFARTVDLFFIGNAPWLLWMGVVGAVFAVVPPRALGPWVGPAMLGCLVPAAWSAWIDLHFFREILQLPPGPAVRALVLNRCLAWVAAIGIFFGIAIWSLYSPQVLSWVGL